MALHLSLGSKSRITIVPGYSEIEIAGDKRAGMAMFTVREGMNRGFVAEVMFGLTGEEMEQLAAMILEARSWEGID